MIVLNVYILASARSFPASFEWFCDSRSKGLFKDGWLANSSSAISSFSCPSEMMPRGMKFHPDALGKGLKFEQEDSLSP
jgi:hypothetical protein